MVCTAGVDAGAIILHDESVDTILERLVQFAESPDDQINQIVDISISLLLIIDGLDVLLLDVIPDAIEIVDSVVNNFHYFLRYEFFLDKCHNTSP